jgi:hypothetical protein
MTSTWQELFDEAQKLFDGQTPGAQLEAQLAAFYEARPHAMQQAISKVAAAYHAGKVHSPWPVLRAELERDAKRATISADETPERELQIHLAERFISNAGWLLPTEAELVDELFGRHGKLKAWASDEVLVSRMVDAWQRARTVPSIQWPQRTSG